MSIKHVILGLLVEQPMHGYGLKGAYEKDIVPHSTINIGQIYQALDRLEPEGFVTFEVVAQSERPDRKVYSLTDKGREELLRWLQAPPSDGAELRNETYLRFVIACRLRANPAFATAINPAVILDAERRSCIAQLHDLTDRRAQAEEQGASLSERVLLELGIQRLTAFYQWLDRCEEILHLTEDQ